MEPLDESLGFLMVRAARVMKRALDVRLAEYHITSVQFTVLYRLWEEDGLSLSELGKRLDFDNPTITGIVDRMEREEFVVRNRDEKDRRVIKIFLTHKGKELKKALPELANQVNNYAVSNFSAEEVAQLKNFLNIIWKRMGNKSYPPPVSKISQ